MDTAYSAQAERLLPWNQNFVAPFLYRESELSKDRRLQIESVYANLDPKPNHQSFSSQQANAILDEILDENPGMIVGRTRSKLTKRVKREEVTLLCHKGKLYQEQHPFREASSIPINTEVEIGRVLPIRVRDRSTNCIVWIAAQVLAMDPETQLYHFQGFHQALDNLVANDETDRLWLSKQDIAFPADVQEKKKWSRFKAVYARPDEFTSADESKYVRRCALRLEDTSYLAYAIEKMEDNGTVTLLRGSVRLPNVAVDDLYAPEVHLFHP